METNKYINGKIYKIVDNTNNNIYIGSTCEKYLKKRLNNHKSNYKRFTEGKNERNVSSYEILKNDNYDIVLIELFPCNSKDELLKRERHYIDTMLCVNKNKPTYLYNGEYNKTYYEKHKEEEKERVKKYRQEHKEHFKNYMREYRAKKKN